MTDRGFHIDGTLPLSRGALEELREVFNSYDRINAFVSEFHLEVPPPVHKPQEPTGAWLAECSTEEYSQAFADWVSYHNYLLSVQSHVVAGLHRLRTQYKQVERRLLQQNYALNRGRTTTTRLSKEVIDVETSSDGVLVELSAEIAEYEQKKLLIDAAVTSAENAWRMLSRQVELRKIDWESNNTNKGNHSDQRRPQPITNQRR